MDSSFREYASSSTRKGDSTFKEGEMNREEIIRIAREAEHLVIEDYYTNGPVRAFSESQLERFAALVASAEREACIVDIQMHIPRSGRDTPEYQMAMRMIERIQARGSHD